MEKYKMGNTVFERNYEIVEKDDRATAVFERAFAPGGFMEEFTKKMDAIPKVVVPKDKENYDYLLDRCDDYAQRHHGRIRGVVDYEHWDAHIDLYLRMLEFDDAEDISVEKEYAQGYEQRYGKKGFMMLIPAPQDLVTGEPNQSAIATINIEKYD